MNAQMRLAIAALLAAPVAAFAQSSVTVYGVLDTYVEYARGGGAGDRTSVQAGGQSGSRLGFRGTEDLGGGLKAMFQLEHGLWNDTGTQDGAEFWRRQAWVGLSGGFGTVALGRQYNPSFLFADSIDPFGTGYGSAFTLGITPFSASGARTNNAVTYATPVLSGFSGKVLVGAGEGVAGRTVDGSVTYAGGPLYLGAAYGQRERFGATAETSSLLVGGSYQLGMFKILGGYDRLEAEAPTNTTRKGWTLGTQVAVNPGGTVSLGYSEAKTDGRADKVKLLSAGYSYALSKRTNVYAIVSRVDNASGAAATAFGPTGASSGNPYTVLAGNNPSSVALGVRHTF
ncbi:porin [Aquabacterium sp. J223]|uniref:porin n=1 Tax=Aquabacterium sp. J223 TaxID=2898431 RepID=UPI0021AD5DD6|nr:porin [Aquabacterium sp. J223]UUX95145.1 porin [Aquabacterium sp. J223]